MNSFRDFPENLLIRARRSELSHAELARLDDLIAASPTLDSALRAGLAFDQVGVVQSGDEQLIAQFVDGALRSARRGRSRRAGLRLSSWMFAAAVFGLCGVAFGTRATWLPLLAPSRSSSAAPTLTATPRQPTAPRPRSSSNPHEIATARIEASLPVMVGEESARDARVGEARAAEANERQAAPARSAMTTGRDRALSFHDSSRVEASARVIAVPEGSGRETTAAEPRATPVIDSQPATESAVEPPMDRVEASAGSGAPPSTAQPAAAVPSGNARLTAEQLLHEANLARAAGHWTTAMTRLLELQRTFPRSREAHLSRVSLGKLYLRSGDAGRALQQFTDYLGQGGALDEEAMVGRAKALAALGRQRDEQATWQLLLDRFPGSAYCRLARERLQRGAVDSR